MFGNVCGHWIATPFLPNVGDHTLHQLEFGNMQFSLSDYLATRASASMIDCLWAWTRPKKPNSATCILIYYGIERDSEVYQSAIATTNSWEQRQQWADNVSLTSRCSRPVTCLSLEILRWIVGNQREGVKRRSKINLFPLRLQYTIWLSWSRTFYASGVGFRS